MSDRGWKGKGQHLFIAIFSLVLIYQVRIMIFALTVFQKLTFQKKSHLNASLSKFDIT